jgi:Fur family transcriptional regulator, ferric uptake regulator
MPVSLSQLGEDPTLSEHYDASTLYRVLLRLEESGLVRRIGLHGRSAHFILRAPGLHSHFLVCRRCGAIREIDINCPVRELDRTIEVETGYRDLEHDLSFYGLCRDCGRSSKNAQRRTP